MALSHARHDNLLPSPQEHKAIRTLSAGLHEVKVSIMSMQARL